MRTSFRAPGPIASGCRVGVGGWDTGGSCSEPGVGLPGFGEGGASCLGRFPSLLEEQGGRACLDLWWPPLGSLQVKRPPPFVPLLSQVGTNGIISTQDFPRETQYVDDGFPTDFPAIAPFLADIDTSQGRGRILYREDTSPEVLDLAARYVRTSFPRTASDFTPTHAFLATWEQVGAYQEPRLGMQPSGEVSDKGCLAAEPVEGWA